MKRDIAHEHIAQVKERQKRISITTKIDIIRKELEDHSYIDAIKEKRRQLADASIMKTMKQNMERHLLKVDAVKWAQSGFATDRRRPAAKDS